tara:strand:- start:95 stop:226 length:132 start_codon:yes stop_codon:yes gene_type:complete
MKIIGAIENIIIDFIFEYFSKKMQKNNVDNKKAVLSPLKKIIT